MKKRVFSWFTIVLSLGMIISGCSSGNVNSKEVGDSSIKADKPVNIRLMGMNYGGMKLITEQMEDVAKTNPNLKVSSKLTDWGDLETQSKVVLSAGGEAPYEVLQAYNGWMPEYISNGWILPITDLYEKYKEQYNLEDIPKELWDVVSTDGEIYGIPYQQNIQHLFFRKDIFEKYGLQPPETFDELFKVLDTLKEKTGNKHPFAVALGGASDAGTEFNNALVAYNGQWFDENDQPTFNSPEGVKALEFLQKLMKYMPKEAISYTNNDVSVALQQEQILITNIWSSRAGEVTDPTISKVADKIAYAVSPSSVKGGVPYTNWTQDVFVIPKNIKQDKDVVFQVLAETVNEENSKEAAAQTIVTRSSVAEKVVKEYPNYKVVTDSIKAGGKAYPIKPYFSSARLIVGGYVQEVLTGKMSPEEALKKAEEDVIKDMKTKGY